MSILKKCLCWFNAKKNNFLDTFSSFNYFSYVVYFSILLVVFVLFLKFPFYTFLVLAAFVVLFFLYALYSNSKFLKNSSGNGIIFGGRGKGKGVLFQKKINSYKKVFSNVPFGKNTEIINIKDYIQSIGDNTIFDSINNTIKVVKKVEKYEGVNIFWDDLSVYAPNFLDNDLKKIYPSLPLTLAVNRHLYNAFMLISVQDRNRPYKILRELQTDFSIKALKTYGFGNFWSSIPFLRFIVCVSYRYYEEVKSAENGVLPFKALGLVNEGVKGAYLTSGQATKEQFKAENGVVFNGRIFMFKSSLTYDTRYFHTLFFGCKSPKKEKKEREKKRALKN